ncbi:MAG: hypothetical protein ACRDYA_24295 [Egibacteraceae bacterium]
MGSADELWQEAERLDREAQRTDDVAAELRTEARLLPEGIELATRWITESVWESSVADQARAMLSQEASSVHRGANDLVRAAMELERRADDLRDLASQHRRQAEALEQTGQRFHGDLQVAEHPEVL